MLYDEEGYELPDVNDQGYPDAVFRAEKRKIEQMLGHELSPVELHMFRSNYQSEFWKFCKGENGFLAVFPVPHKEVTVEEITKLIGRKMDATENTLYQWLKSDPGYEFRKGKNGLEAHPRKK